MLSKAENQLAEQLGIDLALSRDRAIIHFAIQHAREDALQSPPRNTCKWTTCRLNFPDRVDGCAAVSCGVD